MTPKSSRKANVRVRVVEALNTVRQALYKARSSRRMLESLYARSHDPSLMRLIEVYLKLELLLEAVALRLETVALTGVVARELVEPPLRVAREASALRDTLPPDLADLILEVDRSLAAIHDMAAPADYYGLNLDEGNISDDVQRILREAEAVAKRRLEELIGEDGTRQARG